MNWPLAVVIVAVLFFGYCAYTAGQASDNMDRATDEAALYQRCYGAGYEAAVFGEDPTPAAGRQEVRRLVRGPLLRGPALIRRPLTDSDVNPDC